MGSVVKEPFWQELGTGLGEGEPGASKPPIKPSAAAATGDFDRHKADGTPTTLDRAGDGEEGPSVNTAETIARPGAPMPKLEPDMLDKQGNKNKKLLHKNKRRLSWAIGLFGCGGFHQLQKRHSLVQKNKFTAQSTAP